MMTRVSGGTGVEQALKERYARLSAELRPKPKLVNVAVEKRRAIEKAALDEKMEKELTEAAARAAETAVMKDVRKNRFTLSFHTQAAFDVYNDVTVGLTISEVALRPTMEKIAHGVLEGHGGITLDDVRSKCRTSGYVAARKDVVWAIHRIRPEIKLSEIGRFIHRHHSTVLWILDRLEYKRKRSSRRRDEH